MKPKQPQQRVGYFPDAPASASKPSHPHQPSHSTPQQNHAQRPDFSYHPEQRMQPDFSYHPTPTQQPDFSYHQSQQPAPQKRRRATQQPAEPPRRPAPAARSFPNKPKRDLVRIGLFVVCICVFITCAALLISYFSNIAASREASRQLSDVYSAAQEQEATATPTVAPSATPTPTPTQKPIATQAMYVPAATTAPTLDELWPSSYAHNLSLRVSSAFYELQRSNKDIVAWIKIDGVLEEPVLQRDNEYYLTHNALGKRSVTGALFLDETCDLTTVPSQMVIHGHNMKEGAMFGSLKKYKVKDASFYRSHPFIEFNTLYENGRYVIFAVCEVDIRPGTVEYLPFWQYSRFPSISAFNDYIQKARALSHYRCNVDVVPGDRLLTLSTCTGTDDNKRLVVMARKIRPDEKELDLQTSILSTSDR